MDRITRRDLKTDRFAQEVTHSVEYLGVHRKQFLRYAGAALALIVIVFGVRFYRSHRAVRLQAELTEAMRFQEAQIGPSTGNPSILSFPTQAEKDKAAIKAFTDLAAKNSGSDEAWVARYYLGVIAADAGKMAEAGKAFQEVSASAPADTASLARLALSQIYQAVNRSADAEKLLRQLIDKPTILVSKEEATISLARLLAPTNPAEARKLLEPLRTSRSAVSRAALTALGEVPAK